MEKIIENRRLILTVSAVALTLMLVSIMVRAFYSDGQFHPSASWEIFFLTICTVCFSTFALWVFTEGFGRLSLGRSTVMRLLARLYFVVSLVVALFTLVSLVASAYTAVAS